MSSSSDDELPELPELPELSSQALTSDADESQITPYLQSLQGDGTQYTLSSKSKMLGSAEFNFKGVEEEHCMFEWPGASFLGGHTDIPVKMHPIGKQHHSASLVPALLLSRARSSSVLTGFSRA